MCKGPKDESSCRWLSIPSFELCLQVQPIMIPTIWRALGSCARARSRAVHICMCATMLPDAEGVLKRIVVFIGQLVAAMIRSTQISVAQCACAAPHTVAMCCSVCACQFLRAQRRPCTCRACCGGACVPDPGRPRHVATLRVGARPSRVACTAAGQLDDDSRTSSQMMIPARRRIVHNNRITLCIT